MNVGIAYKVFIQDVKLWKQLICTFKLHNNKVYLVLDSDIVDETVDISKFTGILDSDSTIDIWIKQ